jgi:hypothetical protein
MSNNLLFIHLLIFILYVNENSLCIHCTVCQQHKMYSLITEQLCFLHLSNANGDACDGV